jgi:hypothetical protein
VPIDELEILLLDRNTGIVRRKLILCPTRDRVAPWTIPISVLCMNQNGLTFAILAWNSAGRGC